MPQYFSPSRLAFINAKVWDDCVFVEQEVYSDITKKLGAGTHTLGQSAGNPIAIEKAPVVPREITPDEALYSATARLNADYDAAVQQLKSGYPATESDTWPKQLEEANKYKHYLLNKDNGEVLEPFTPFIDALLESRQHKGEETKEVLVNRIIELSDLLAPLVGSLTGKRQTADFALRQAKELHNTVEAINSVTWNFN